LRAPALAALSRRIASGPTLATLIEGRGNNFDALRLAAALAVLFGHGFVLAVGHLDLASVDPVSRILMPVAGFGEAIHELAVDLFFVVSGFLVTRSLKQRASLADFAEARVLRLFPAAIVSTVVTIIGLSFFSTLPAAAYFADPETWEYLLRNTFLWSVDYDLPGLFADNPYPVPSMDRCGPCRSNCAATCSSRCSASRDLRAGGCWQAPPFASRSSSIWCRTGRTC